MANEKQNFEKWGQANHDLGIFSRLVPSQIKLEFLSLNPNVSQCHYRALRCYNRCRMHVLGLL